MVIDTYLLTVGIIGLLTFFLTPIAIQLIGAYHYRKEIIEDLKKTWNTLKNNQ
jgi:hypothetical protein